MRVAAAALLLLSILHAQDGSMGLSDDFRKAAEDSFDAISLVSDSVVRKDSDFSFQIRLFDAEKSLKRTKRARKNAQDNDAFSVLDAWLFFKEEAYSEESASRNTVNWAGQTQCEAEARILFDLSSLSSKGKEMAAQKTCLKMLKSN
jgi:AAA+ ATPase superfamily predicted ATPase